MMMQAFRPTTMSVMARNASMQRAILAPAASVQSLAQAKRYIQTQPMSPDQALAELNRQRSLRPNSPWAIYAPQWTSVPSIFNRVTGAGLSVGLYALFLGHLAGLDSAALISFWADLPGWFQYTVKGAGAAAASFHSFNGIRHLGWDMVKGIELKSAYATGYTVAGLTVVSTIGLLML